MEEMEDLEEVYKASPHSPPCSFSSFLTFVSRGPVPSLGSRNRTRAPGDAFGRGQGTNYAVFSVGLRASWIG